MSVSPGWQNGPQYQQSNGKPPAAYPNGRNPYQAFNQPDIAQPNPSNIAPPKSSTIRPVWAVVLSLLAIGVLFFIPTMFSKNFLTPNPTASPTVSRYQPPTILEGVNGIPWESYNGSGTWQIDSHEFDQDGLNLTMTLRVEKGSLSYSWFAFDVRAVEIHYPKFTGDKPLRPDTVDAGETVTGTVRFEVEKQPITVVLANANGSQITALRVKP